MMTELLLLATGGWLVYIGASSLAAAAVCLMLAALMTLALDAFLPGYRVSAHAPAFLGVALVGCWLGCSMLSFPEPLLLGVPLLAAAAGAALGLSFALLVQRWLQDDSQTSW